MALHNEPNRPDPGNRQEDTGGADAVEKTTYTSPHGAEPTPPRTHDAPSGPAVRSSGGFGAVGWIILAILVLAMIVYGLGGLRG